MVLIASGGQVYVGYTEGIRSKSCIQGGVYVDRKEEAMDIVKEWKDRSGTMWTDGSRLESGRVGAAVSWWSKGGWTGRGTYLGTNKEVFDAEVFAILQAVKLLNERGGEGQTYTASPDSQAAVANVPTGVVG